jgi:hypothetical protein
MPIIPVGEMHTTFLHLLDKQSNYTAPEITPEEVDIYLNLAQVKLMDYFTEEGVEKNQNWADMTKNVTKSYVFTPYTNSTNKPNGFYINLPSDYRLTLLETATITYPGCAGVPTTNRVTVTPITRDMYNKIVVNPFGKAWKEEILRLVSDANKYELIADTGITVTTYYLDYLAQPPKIEYGSQYSTPSPDVDCVLETKAAEQVIYMGVNMALQTLGDPRLSYVAYNPYIKSIN